MKEYVFMDELVLETPLKVDAPTEYEFILIVPFNDADQGILEVY